MLRGFILAFHVLLAFMIVMLVLLQRGKGAEAGAGFGSGASGTVFGARGTSTLFSRLTAVFAALFFVTSLTLAYVGTQASAVPATLLERAAQAETTTATPVTPPPSTPPPSTPTSSTPVQSAPATPVSTPPPAPANRP
ncbi:MAG: preprotein translocase subunit SecG [Steroidobacteraceae bacterium]|jgi:preprotein translocase subunit SecG